MDPKIPCVSVLMVAYNSSKFIRQAMESVLAQTYPNFELIVIDDNSSDDTWDIINTFLDPRVKKIRNAGNLKEYPNRNKAIELASGEYAIFIDADDLIYPHGLQFMIQYAIQFPDCAMIISRPWDERIIFPTRITPHQFFCFEYIDRGAVGINFTKVMFKTSVLKSAKRFPDSVKFGDLYIQYLIALHHNSVLIPDASTWWRRRPGQASEAYLQNYDQYLQHELWIKLEMLWRVDCPLSREERDLGAFNLYGNYLRFLVKELLRMKWGTVARLVRVYPIPRKYRGALLRKQKRDYFSRYTGECPLH